MSRLARFVGGKKRPDSLRSLTFGGPDVGTPELHSPSCSHRLTERGVRAFQAFGGVRRAIFSVESGVILERSLAKRDGTP